MAIANFKFHNAIVVASLLAVFLIIAIQLANQQKVSAQATPIYFGDPRQCELYDPVRCPPGTVEDGNYCRPLSSEFCRVFTGSPNVTTVNFNGEQRPVCAAQTQIGTCTIGSIGYTPPGGRGSLAGITPAFTNKIGELITTFNNTKSTSFSGEGWDENNVNRFSATATPENIWDLLFEGDASITSYAVPVMNVRNADFLYYIKSKDKSAVACVTPENSQRQYITIPVTMPLKQGRWDRAYDRQVVDLGFVLSKPSTGNYYCKDRNHLAVLPDVANLSSYKCTDSLSIGSRGCVVKGLKINTQDTTGVSKCIRNLSLVSSTDPKGTGTMVRAGSAGALATSGNNFSITQSDENSPFCRQNAKDIFAVRSNKGCSDFITLNTSDNTLSAGNPDRYQECVKCLYGEQGTLAGITGTLRVTLGTQPVNGNPITPYNEPLANPISGRLYTDLGGCINASSTGSVVNTIVRVALGVMGGIVILRIIQGALTMQKGDPEGFQEGREVITSALIGLLLLIFSAAVLNFLGINILGLDVATFGS